MYTVMEFYLNKSAPIGNSYAEDRHSSSLFRPPVASKINGFILPRIRRIFLYSDGALLSSESVPKSVIGQVARLRENLSEFPSKWAGKRRIVGRIAKKQQKKRPGFPQADTIQDSGSF